MGQIVVHRGGGVSLANAGLVYASGKAQLSLPQVRGGRLTLTSGVPVTTADVTGATTIYDTPYDGDLIALYDGSSKWDVLSFSEISIPLGTLTSGLPYDLFAYNNGGVVAYDSPVAWTNGTTRATALVLQNGVWVKSGATTRRYRGSFYTTSTTTTEDSEAKRFLFNAINRVARRLYRHDNTDSWVYSSAAWRAWNNSTANRVEWLLGLNDDIIRLRFFAHIGPGGVAGGGAPQIGIDSTTVPSANVAANFSASGQSAFHAVDYSEYAGLGYHFAQMLEYGHALGLTFFGDNASTDLRIKSAMQGWLNA